MLSRLSSARSALPYGVVMATGGASRLARPAGLALLATPLLGVAVAQTVAIAILAAWRSRRPRPTGRRHAQGRFGEFTIPLGLAVVGTVLADRGSAATQVAATAAVGLAWLATVYLVCTVVMPVAAHRPELSIVDGAWFLAPAALLGDAIGLVALMPAGSGPTRQALGWAAVAVGGAGYCTYWLVVALAAARCSRLGTGAEGRATWWISAGCGGLAAAAVGAVQTVAPIAVTADWFTWTALAAWAAGTALLIPVLGASIAYVVRLVRDRSWGTPVWPPTFSTAVYALGALQAGRLADVHPIDHVGTAAAGATVALWLATTALYTANLARRQHRRVSVASSQNLRER